VRYVPTQAGSSTQTVTFTGGGGASATVSGSASLPAAIAVTPGSQDYGAVLVGSTNDLTFTVRNTGGGTLAGTASAPAPFSIVGTSSYSLANNATQVITVRYVPAQAESSTQTVTFTGGGGANATASGSADPWVISFDAIAGIITAPFTTNADNTISQSLETDDPTNGGRALFVFNLPSAKDCVVSANVYAPDEAANSVLVDIDQEPTSPQKIWDIPVQPVFQDKKVILRGTGGLTPPYVWSLNAGPHQLIVRGRDAGAKLRRVSIDSNVLPPPQVP